MSQRSPQWVLPALALLGGLGSGHASAADVNGCPTSDASSFTDPWLLVSAGDGSVEARRPRRRRLRVRRARRRAGSGAAHGRHGQHDRQPRHHPARPCTNPFVPVTVGNPNIIGNPNIREIDANGDSALCGTASLAARALIIILVDNPNAIR